MERVGGYAVAEKPSLAILKYYLFMVCGWRAVYRFPLRIRTHNRRLMV